MKPKLAKAKPKSKAAKKEPAAEEDAAVKAEEGPEERPVDQVLKKTSRGRSIASVDYKESGGEGRIAQQKLLRKEEAMAESEAAAVAALGAGAQAFRQAFSFDHVFLFLLKKIWVTKSGSVGPTFIRQMLE